MATRVVTLEVVVVVTLEVVVVVTRGVGVERLTDTNMQTKRRPVFGVTMYQKTILCPSSSYSYPSRVSSCSSSLARGNEVEEGVEGVDGIDGVISSSEGA